MARYVYRTVLMITIGILMVPLVSSPASALVLPRTSYSGMNLARAIAKAKAHHLSPYYVGGGTFGVIVTSDWTVCFAKQRQKSITFFAAKDCAPDSNSQGGKAAPEAFVSRLIKKNLQAAENKLQSRHYGFNEIGGGALGIWDPADWTVCYATRKAQGKHRGRAELYAAKSCHPEAG